ncbi:hypothetical protein GTW20_13395 [Nocardiopsis alba]|uniref:HipA-like C-terminal domain-containing protein n=1 Tax=Nocardiopsis alba TaxID=53437 RepID=A0A7K2ITD2_9ACTN|nr:hypothetical protein [Nocardiopsis alba]MYR33232.1 hypothetical protein [Nocardiopsis alba]
MTGVWWIRIDVSGWQDHGVEQSGSNGGRWLEDPGTGRRWLHKKTHVPANGCEQGEDWAEVIATQVAQALGVPCAPTMLCVHEGRRGSLSCSIRPDQYDLWGGQIVLEEAEAPGYFRFTPGRAVGDPERPNIRRPGHSLTNIRAALQGVDAPEGFEGCSKGGRAFDAFVGYTLLDALIANRDRHDENWAVLQPQLGSLPGILAPTYDHGSSLGYNFSGPKRDRCLADSEELERWAMRGTAHRYEHEPPAKTLVDHAVEALGMGSPDTAKWWTEQVLLLDLSEILEPLEQGAIPEMSEASVKFAAALLKLNLRRLQDAISDHA